MKDVALALVVLTRECREQAWTGSAARRGFLLTPGLLSKFYLYGQVAVTPADAEIDVVASTAPDAPATYFDIGKLKEVTAQLENRTRIRGYPAEGEKVSEDLGEDLGEDVVVWDAYACTGVAGDNCLNNELPISGQRDLVAIGACRSMVRRGT